MSLGRSPQVPYDRRPYCAKDSCLKTLCNTVLCNWEINSQIINMCEIVLWPRVNPKIGIQNPKYRHKNTQFSCFSYLCLQAYKLFRRRVVLVWKDMSLNEHSASRTPLSSIRTLNTRTCRQRTNLPVECPLSNPPPNWAGAECTRQSQMHSLAAFFARRPSNKKNILQGERRSLPPFQSTMQSQPLVENLQCQSPKTFPQHFGFHGLKIKELLATCVTA